MSPSRRIPVKKSSSVRLFQKNTNRTKAANLVNTPMRGGWRL